jgi:alternate signal-mediated exported protein
MTGARRVLPLAVAALIAALVIGGTWALWGSQSAFRGGSVIAGDLEVTLGDATWRQVTPGVSDPQQGVFDGTTPDDFFSMPGDVIEVWQPITSTLRGDNVAGGMTVRFSDPDAVSSDVAAGRIAVGFAVLDDTGTQVAPATGSAELGSTVAVPGMTGTDVGVSEDWTVVIRVEVLGDYVWVDGAPIAGAGLWETGDVRVELRQVREGEGFGGAG